MGLVRSCLDNLLVSATLCFLAGAAVAALLPTLPTGVALGAPLLPLLLILACLAYALGPKQAPLAALPFLFLVGLLHTSAALQPITDPDHIAAQISRKTQVTLIGRMLSMVEADGEKSRFVLGAEAILFHDDSARTVPSPVRGKVQLTVPGDLDPRFVPGSRILVLATVDRIRNYQTPGAFDYQLQMASQSLFCSGWVRSAGEMQLVLEPAPSLLNRLRFGPEQLRQHVARQLEQRFDRQTAGFYQALLIGSTVNIPPAQIEHFKDNGCFHALSISGLHMSLLGLFSVWVLNLLLKRSQWLLLHTHVPTLSLALTAPLLLLYTGIAGFSVPAIRSLLAALLVLFAVVVRRRRSLLPLICASALAVLAFCPLALFTPSFQLSFGAVLAIGLLYPRLPMLGVPEDGEAAPRRALLSGLRVVQSMLMVSVAATVGTLPILLYHFNRFSLIGPVMNLLIEPLLCLWALPLGLLALPLLACAPEAAGPLLQLGGLGIHAATRLADAAAGFPWASVWTITPTLWETALFVLIIAVLLGLTRNRYPSALGLSILLILSFTSSLWLRHSGALTVEYLDVGRGSSTLIRMPDGGTVLIDGGGYQSDRFDPGQNLIGPFLWKKRLWRIDDLIVTHPHQDHFNGLPFVLSHFHPKRLIISSDQGADPAYNRFLAAAHRAATAILRPAAGAFLLQEPGLSLRCLGMTGLLDDRLAWSTNDRSLVVRLQFGGRSFLFPGDISAQGEQRLLASGFPLTADVLLAPHHGSPTSSSREFLAAVGPRVVILSTGQSPSEGGRFSDGLAEWQRRHPAVLHTTRAGTITCRTNGRTLSVAVQFAGKFSFYEEKERKITEKMGLMGEL